MWNATIIAGNARSRVAALEAAIAAGGEAATLVTAARELVVARHLAALDCLFTRDDVDGCLGEFVAAAQSWQRATADPSLRPSLRKSWSLALEGAIVAGRQDVAATLSRRTADETVPPEYDDEFAAAACLEIWCRAGQALPDERAAVEALCDRAEQYLGGPQPTFDVFRAAASAAPDFAARFVDWHEWHLRDIDERLAGPSLRPFEVMLAHCWTRGLAVLRCAQRGGVDLLGAGLLVPRRFLPTTLLAMLAEDGRG